MDRSPDQKVLQEAVPKDERGRIPRPLFWPSDQAITEKHFGIAVGVRYTTYLSELTPDGDGRKEQVTTHAVTVWVCLPLKMTSWSPALLLWALQKNYHLVEAAILAAHAPEVRFCDVKITGISFDFR